MAGGAYYGDDPGYDDSSLMTIPPVPPSDTYFQWMRDQDAANNPTGNNQNYTGNPFDPYGSTTNTENNVLPYDPNQDANINPFIPGQGNTNTIPVNNDPGVIGSSSYDPTAGLTPNNTGPTNLNDGLSMGGGMPGGSGGGGIFGGGNGSVLPIPGIDPLTAIGASILLSNGNIFGGGGSGGLGAVASQVGNIASNPVGSINSSITNLGNGIMGPTGPSQGAGTISAIPISLGGGNNPSSVSPVTQNPVVPPPVESNPNPVVAPVNNPIGQQVQNNNQQNVLNTQTPTIPTGAGTDNSTKVTIAPGLPPTQPPGPAPVNTGTDNGPPPVAVTPTPVTPPGPAPTNPPTQTDTNNPTTVVPVTPVTPPTTGGSTNPNPVVVTPTTPTVPDTSVVSPLDRNFYNEGSQSTSDLQRLLGGIAGLYGNASGSAGQTDFTNFQNILSQFGGANSNLTGLANDQTQAANTALRTNNLNDVQNLLPQATAIRNAANPGLLGDSGSLQNYSNGAASFLQQAQQQQNDANFLSPQEMNTAQQSARNAWSARGLVNSPGAVGAEILNTDSALRARQQQAFSNTQSALGTYGQSVNAQQQNSFDPFNAILGSAYGQQTNNAGSNSNLYGQSSAFSSGQQGNAYAQNMSNPFSPYAQDVYGSNFNAANARNISASNNAAAVAGANTAQSSALANSFLRLFGQAALGSPGTAGSPGFLTGLIGSCWVAREIFGENDPRWAQFRHWLLNIGPKWFLKLYLKHGEKFAQWLKTNAWAKYPIRVFMESKIKTLSFETMTQAEIYFDAWHFQKDEMIFWDTNGTAASRELLSPETLKLIGDFCKWPSNGHNAKVTNAVVAQVLAMIDAYQIKFPERKIDADFHTWANSRLKKEEVAELV